MKRFLHVLGDANPFTVRPNYQCWSPYLGRRTRKSKQIFNTEYAKCKPSVAAELQQAIPEELIVHTLGKEKVSA